MLGLPGAGGGGGVAVKGGLGDDAVAEEYCRGLSDGWIE